MADLSPAPALPSTADPTPYVPVSWMAVAAALVTGLFLVVLLVLGISAFVGKRPLIMPELLVFPVIGVVLSFAARRLIRNSEGTRTGERLVNAAWWVSLVAGLGYSAYLFAIDLSIRRDAEGEVQRWVGYLVKNDKDDLERAFLRTLDPARRANLKPGSPDIQAQFRDALVAFGQCDVVLLTRRNPGEGVCTFTPGGLKDWSYKPGGIDCVFTGVLKCPEGVFPLNIPLRGMEGVSGVEGGTRQWTIIPSENGYISRSTMSLTPYGWLVVELQLSGGQFGRSFLNRLDVGSLMFPLAYHEYIGPVTKQQHWQAVGEAAPVRMAVGGVAGALAPYHTTEMTDFYRNRFFRLLGGGEPTGDLKQKFADSWNNFGLVAPGRRLRNSPDTRDDIIITENAIEIRIPCELPFATAEGSSSAARCRLVVACTDPTLLADFKRLRAEANPDHATDTPPPSVAKRNLNWRVVRVETDLNPITLSTRQDREGPGGGQ